MGVGVGRREKENKEAKKRKREDNLYSVILNRITS